MTDTDALVEAPVPSPTPSNGNHPTAPRSKTVRTSRPRQVSRRDAAYIQLIQEQCLKLCLSAFFREQAPAKSLGFTSAVNGEGKSLLALMTSTVLANQSGKPVTLIECNWEHPCVHDRFGVPATPGLAEWLRHECGLADIRQQVDQNLTVIPAGESSRDAIALLGILRERGIQQALGGLDHLAILDLPSVVTTSYGALAARLADSLILVVRAGVTPEAAVAQARDDLGAARIEGVLLNQLRSNIPRWLQHIL
jgi:Mrp family chromosome partitioning ATPase